MKNKKFAKSIKSCLHKRTKDFVYREDDLTISWLSKYGMRMFLRWYTENNDEGSQIFAMSLSGAFLFDSQVPKPRYGAGTVTAVVEERLIDDGLLPYVINAMNQSVAIANRYNKHVVLDMR